MFWWNLSEIIKLFGQKPIHTWFGYGKIDAKHWTILIKKNQQIYLKIDDSIV